MTDNNKNGLILILITQNNNTAAALSNSNSKQQLQVRNACNCKHLKLATETNKKMFQKNILVASPATNISNQQQ